LISFRNHLSNHHQKPEYKCTEEKKFTSLVGKNKCKSFFFFYYFVSYILKILLIGNLHLKVVLDQNMLKIVVPKANQTIKQLNIIIVIVPDRVSKIVLKKIFFFEKLQQF
jgi:hypothetical protein